MRILIIGSTGFIGRNLFKELQEHGHQPAGVSRNRSRALKILGSEAEVIEWDGRSVPVLADAIGNFDAVVNLAGENLAGGRWTAKRKKSIIDSRIGIGRVLVEAIETASKKPQVLIQGSATGIYGTRVESPADESFPAGNGFIAELAHDWEESVRPAEKILRRVVWLRMGPVLGENSGMMKKLLMPFKFYSGTIVGPGNQLMSWIHITDLVRAVRFLLEHENSSGPYNLTTLKPSSIKDFINSIGKITGRPVWMKVPGWALKIIFGHMAEETILASQNIYPARLLREGFNFEYTDHENALKNLLEK